MHRRYLLAFDGRRGTGSREHFFHYMWGYLLPAVDAIIGVRASPSSHACEIEYTFASCGPVMDARTVEMAELLGLEFSIADDGGDPREPGITRIVVPRWDLFLCDWAAYADLNLASATRRAIRQAVTHRSIPPILRSKRRLRDAIHRVRHTVLAAIAPRDDAGSSTNGGPSYYILKRSEEPAFYAPRNGSAKRPTYGTARRSLVHLEEAAAALTRRHHDVAVFEPGRHTLPDQIRRFRDCKGIIAIRGAELANIVWMEPTSKVIVINAGTFELANPPALGIAKLLGISYRQIDWGADPYPELSDALIERISGHLGS